MAYVDNVILVFASCVKLQAMLKACEEFGMLCDLKFNIIKLSAGCVSRSELEVGVPFFLENKVLLRVAKFKHLGKVLNTKRVLQVDCSEWIYKYIATV